MNIIAQHIKYLQDNPEGYWFKRKLYGYGWTPARPAGWVTVGLYIAFLLGIALYVETTNSVVQSVDLAVSAIIGATILLLLICIKKGESPRWQWGQDENDTQ
jgi:hypothetical protein